MAHYYFIVGCSAAGKSTLDRNLRLRLAGKFICGFRQYVGQDTMFIGRVLFTNGQKVLRLSGGDVTSFDELYRGIDVEKVVFEKAHIPPRIVSVLRNAGHYVTFLHLQVTLEEARRRLRLLDHPSADKDVYKHPPFHPALEEYRRKRDEEVLDQGAEIVYIDGSLLDRCRQVESILKVTPRFDHILYDFKDSVESIYSRFMNGGDAVRA